MKSHGVLGTAGVFLMCVALGHAQEQRAKEHFNRGKQLIEANGADSMGATRHGLEKGIAEIREAIEAGYEDQASAHKLLAHAYNDLAFVYARNDPKEQKEMMLLQKEALEKALALTPGDARTRIQYARVIGDRNMMIAALLNVLATDPNDAETRYSLGMWLLDSGQIDEGVPHLKKAVEQAGLYQGQIYARRARSALAEKGAKAEAAEIRNLIETMKAPFLLSRQTVERLSALQPGQGRMRAELARVVKDAETQSGQLQNILAGNPTDSRAMFSLAMVLLYNGQFKEGVMYLERVLGSVDPNRQQIYGGIAQNFLIEEGKGSEAAEVAKLIAEKRPKPN